MDRYCYAATAVVVNYLIRSYVCGDFGVTDNLAPPSSMAAASGPT